MRSLAVAGVLFTATLLTGCGDDQAKSSEIEIRTQVGNQISKTVQNIASLSVKLDKRELSNAKMVFLYADVIEKDSPELSAIVKQLKEDATSKGGLFIS